MSLSSRAAVVPSLLLALACWTGASRDPAQAPPQPLERWADVPSLTVSGTGRVAAEPDRAWVSIGAEAQASDAAAAQNQVNTAVQATVAAVRALGVPEESLRTQGISLEPVYSDVPRGPDEPPVPPRLAAYRASNVVRVRVDDVARVGAVLDAGLGARANRLAGLELELSDELPFRREALALAVRSARAKAEAIAEATGVRLVAVLEVTEGDAGGPIPLQRSFAMAEGVSTPVLGGEIDVVANVTVRYRITETGTGTREASAPPR